MENINVNWFFKNKTVLHLGFMSVRNRIKITKFMEWRKKFVGFQYYLAYQEKILNFSFWISYIVVMLLDSD